MIGCQCGDKRKAGGIFRVHARYVIGLSHIFCKAMMGKIGAILIPRGWQMTRQSESNTKGRNTGVLELVLSILGKYPSSDSISVCETMNTHEQEKLKNWSVAF